MLDEVHADLPAGPDDDNAYILGRMSSHNIVIACLPAGIVGWLPAATVARQMLSTFQSIRFSLMVGIGGGVPSQVDIRLGDVVVAQPTKNHGGVISSLNKPPRILLNALSKLQAIHLFNGSHIEGLLSDLETKYPLMASILQQRSQDRLFRADYHHHTEPTNVACGACDKSQVQPRPPRYGKASSGPCIHYGLIASGNEVVKDSGIRDQLARQSGILCFEMEAAGLMDDFPCLVIRGISDYADSHKNDTWQGYAAATAAAYAKELLSVIPTVLVENM
ncbi:nucleoside phosphorylase domain-containing protein [Aspergillus ambiguus]|uniref:5'-methylthioadenosine/S-adenosylhomocysteine nucleosidase family protein n=1 Tax=Aspergillus ambiguus TaxID=176160 RepID=UPI003CCCAC9D